MKSSVVDIPRCLDDRLKGGHAFIFEGHGLPPVGPQHQHGLDLYIYNVMQCPALEPEIIGSIVSGDMAISPRLSGLPSAFCPTEDHSSNI